MPNNITKAADYIGLVHLVIDENTDDMFNEFAFEVEKQVLRGDNQTNFGLLGDDVYIALIADLDANNLPQTTKYINLINGKTYTDNSGEETTFLGLRKMLTYFVYSAWIKDNMFQESELGTIQTMGENSIKVLQKQVNRRGNKRWNKGADYYDREVYDYLLFNQSDFPNWNFTKSIRYITTGII